MKNLNAFLIQMLFVMLFSCENQTTKNYNYSFDKYSNGLIQSIINGNDTINYDRVYFYPTGEIWGYEKYKNGLKHGLSIFFYKDGLLKSKWNYFEGHPDGYCYNYGNSIEGYPMEFLVYSGDGHLILRKKFDIEGKLISTEGKIPDDW